MHRYPPSPVSMQVAFPAHGLDEHRRVSVVGGKRKKKEMLFLDLSRSLTPPPLPVFFPSCFCLHSRSHSHHSILSPRTKTENVTKHVARASSSYAPAEREMCCENSQGGQTELEASYSPPLCSLFCWRGSKGFKCDNDHCRLLSVNSKWGYWNGENEKCSFFQTTITFWLLYTLYSPVESFIVVLSCTLHYSTSRMFCSYSAQCSVLCCSIQLTFFLG